MTQALPILKEAGFDAISPVWQADSQMEKIFSHIQVIIYQLL